MSQPRCKHRKEEYCIRTECVGPCETVDVIYISDEEAEAIMEWLDNDGKTLN